VSIGKEGDVVVLRVGMSWTK